MSTTRDEAREAYGKRYREYLDHGFIALRETMGSDNEIALAARTSYKQGTKTVSDDRGLIRRLMRDRHCYHPDMQVLTVSGWKMWKECGLIETFLIPDPQTRTFQKETLEVKRFPNDGEMYTFSNSRMSYVVTEDHKMWFRRRNAEGFSKIAVQDMHKWGHFDPMAGYKMFDGEVEYDPELCFVGFYLGDGSHASKNTITFHLKKERKKELLRKLVSELKLSCQEKQSATYSDAIVFTIETPAFLHQWIHVDCRAKDKSFDLGSIQTLTHQQVYGLFCGLLNSDGNVASDRPQLRFSSSSTNLIRVFETLAAYLGIDAHKTKTGSILNAHIGARTTLESRKQYHGRMNYSGDVFCATSSTGLLMVRGKDTDFAFVCGNTSPFEMAEVKFHIKIPIVVMRQLVRHRTANLNEMSARYSVLPGEFYIPTQLHFQDKKNKQGASEPVPEVMNEYFTDKMRRSAEEATVFYNEMLEYGIAREEARFDLPINIYTEVFWKCDLHNFLHYCGLRMDRHAQPPIRHMATAMYELAKEVFPATCEAFEDYRLNSCTFSRMEMEYLRLLLSSSTFVMDESDKEHIRTRFGMTKNELEDFFSKIIKRN